MQANKQLIEAAQTGTVVFRICIWLKVHAMQNLFSFREKTRILTHSSIFYTNFFMIDAVFAFFNPLTCVSSSGQFKCSHFVNNVRILGLKCASTCFSIRRVLAYTKGFRFASIRKTTPTPTQFPAVTVMCEHSQKLLLLLKHLEV